MVVGIVIVIRTGTAFAHGFAFVLFWPGLHGSRHGLAFELF